MLEQLAHIINKFSNGDGIHETAIRGLRCIKSSLTDVPTPTVYTPSVCFIAQGRKQVLLKNEIYEYKPQEYLAVSVELPVIGLITEASQACPYLCLQVDLDQEQLTELLLQTPALAQNSNTTRGIFVGHVHTTLQDCVLRLAQLLESPQDIAALAPTIKRELFYRLLTGDNGAHIAQLAQTGSHLQRIATSIDALKNAYNKPLRIEDMANSAGMSVSSFHAHFKNVTALSPLQYQKHLRLTTARRLMLTESQSAAHAAYHVGYESLSQFNREYARMFGNPPRRDIMQLKAVTQSV